MRHLCLGEIKGSYHFYVPKHMRLGGEAVFCLPGGLLGCIQKEARQTGALLPGDAGGPYLDFWVPLPPLVLHSLLTP